MADLPDYIKDMETFMSVPYNPEAEENGMLQIAYAIRALVYETRKTNEQLDLINFNLDRIWNR